MDAAQSGNTIQIQPGTYQEQVKVTQKNNFAEAAEADRIIIEADPLAPLGSVVVQPPATSCLSGQAVLIRQSKFVTLRGLTITGAVGTGVVLLGGSQQNQAIHIERSRIFGNSSPSCPGGGILIALGNPDTLIVNTLIHGNGGNGITFADFGGGPHWLIQNTIHGNGWNGVGILVGHTMTLANNLITANGQASGTLGGRQGIKRAVLFGQAPEDILLHSNLICGNRLGEIKGPALDATDSGNLTPGGTEGPGVIASPGCEIPANVFANLNGSDAFPNTSDDDFSLASASPAIDQGLDPRTLGLNVLFDPILESDFANQAIRPSDGNADRVLAFDMGGFEFPNTPPVANAGPDQSVARGVLVTLDGTQSQDPEGATLTFQWTLIAQPPGSTVSLNDPTSATPQFTPLLPGDYLFDLVVNDGQFDSIPDTVVVTAVNGIPTADANGPYTGSFNVPIQFSGTGTDPDGDALTFTWDFGDGGTASGATPTHTYATGGTFTVVLTVTDAFGAIGTSQTTATVISGPVLDPIGDKTVNVGSTLSFTVTASGGIGPLTFSVTPLPLPPNASFNVVTGLFTFAPDLTQVGSFQITFTVTSDDQSDSETITITVPQPDPAGVTAFTGRVLDANDFDGGITTPVVGATISFLGTGQSAVSDVQGNFTISGLPAGSQILDINSSTASPAPDGSSYAGFREETELISGVNNVIDRPFFLPRIAANSLTTVDPIATTVVTNPDLGVTLTIPPNTAKNPDGSNFTGQLSISLVPRELAPVALPDTLDPGLLITIQPVGVTFSTPVPITFPNTDNLPPGNEVDIWSLDPDTGTFVVVGTGLVSADGTKIETISGGIRAADWHFELSPDGDADLDVDEGEGLVQDPSKQCTPQAGSTVALQNGCLGVNFSLPSHRSLGVSRSLKFVYKSNRANPQPVIPFNATISVRAAVPPKMSYQLSVAGVDQGVETFVNTSGLNENIDETIRSAVSFDASSFETGLFPYVIRLTSNYFSSRVSSTISDRVLVINEQNSSFGAGWGLEGLGRLHFNDDGSLLFTSGEGLAILFSGGPDTFSSPAGDFSTLIRNPDGTFTRTFKDGTQINFSAQGLQTSVVDRNGNTTNYAYDANGRLVSITDPAGLVTTFAYTGDLLSSVTDPAGRITTFTHDAEGNLTQVTFPDGSSKSFGYDLKHLMTTETNERGFTVQREYDSAGRLVKATLSDGSIRSATSAQNVGFVDLLSGLGTATNPAPVIRPADALSTFTDGNGNQQIVKIGRFGAPLRITDPLGQTTLIERRTGNDGTLQGGASFATGQVGQAFSFDGVDDSVVVPDSPMLNPISAITLATWVFVTGKQGQHRDIISKDGETFDRQYLLTASNVNRFRAHIGVPSSTTFPGGIHHFDGITPVQLNTWYHVAMTYDGAFLKLYVNGVLDGSLSVSGPIIRTPQPVRIGGGAPPGTAQLHFPGLIDEAEIYDRALSATEIAATFTSGNSGNRTTPLPSLVSRWQGEGDAIDIAGAHGLPTKITRPNGATTSMTYDSRGNLLTSTDPVGATTTFTYEPTFNQVATIKDPKNNTTTINYDTKGNPIEIVDPLGNKTQMTYDLRGLLSSVTSGVLTPEQNTTTFNYDLKGNLITTTDPLLNTTTLEYDSAGNVIKSTDAEGRVTEFTYDSLNRLISVLDPDLNVTSYTYDARGNLTQVTDAKNQITTFTYDALDRLVSATNPLGFTETFTYDANGNLTSTTNRNLETISFVYDALNRLISKTRPPTSAEIGPQVTTFTYDTVGNLTSVVDPDSTVNMAYDLANRLTSSTFSSSLVPLQTTAYTYDLNGNRLTMTDPQNGLTTYVYDALNRLTSLTNPSAQATSFSYDALSRRTSVTHSNGVTTSFQYDLASQSTNLAHVLGVTSINSFSYAYDKVGNRTTKTDNLGPATYTYDPLNRLVNAANPIPTNPTETYTYDAVGNRVNSNQNGASIFNQANQLTEDADFTYEYDFNGNLSRKTDKVTGAFTLFEYDAESKLIRLVKPDGVVVNYRYDGLGRRIEKEIVDFATTVTQYIYDNEDILLELDGSNNIVARYTHGPGIDEPLVMEKGGTSFFYQADGLGSITEITDTIGTVVQAFTYSSFGKIESQLDPNFIQPYTFTSREFDPETGLYHYRARAYDPSSGRFLQEDPLGSNGGDINFYTYVANNPVNLKDPTGELIDVIADIAFIGYDLFRLVQDNLINDCGNLGTNLTALGADLASVFIPGVTGLGAGVRATRGVAKVGGKITGYTKHGLNQAIGREGVGVAPRAILDAVKNPRRVVQRTGGVTEYVGDAARVRLNEAGKVVTVIPTSRQGFRGFAGR